MTLAQESNGQPAGPRGPRSQAEERAHKGRTEEVTGAVTVGASLDEAYGFWRDLRNLPRFVMGLTAVEVTGDRRARCTVTLSHGRPVVWDVEIVDETPGERIAWCARGSADVAGVVRFCAAPGGRGTEVHVALRSASHRGPIGMAIARLFGPAIELTVACNLRRFKQVMETGEVVVSDATLRPGTHPARPPEEVVHLRPREPRAEGGER